MKFHRQSTAESDKRACEVQVIKKTALMEEL